MTHRGQIIIEEKSLKRFKERANDVRRFATVIRNVFLCGVGIVHIMYSDAAHSLLRETFGSGFIE